MVLITIIVNPHKVEDVRAAATAIGVQGITAAEVKGYGPQHEHSEFYRGAEHNVDFRPKMKIEIAVRSDLSEQVIEAVQIAAGAGKGSAGTIFVTKLEQVIRVRTGEIGVAAI